MVAVSFFGMRQEVYESCQGVGPNRTRTNLLGAYDRSNMTGRIRGLISRPLPGGLTDMKSWRAASISMSRPA